MILAMLLVVLVFGCLCLPAQAAPSGDSPAFSLRGAIIGGLPMYAGGGATGYYWDSFKAQWEGVDETFDHPFCRLDYWRERLGRLAGEGYNAILFLHPHPFPGLVEIPEFPEAATLTPEQLQRNKAWFHGLIDEAEARGIRIYILTWSIFLPGPFARAHNLPYHGQVFEYAGADTPESRAYTAAAYRAFFREYPQVGLAPTVGENPVPCVDFTRAALCDTVAAMDPQPHIILRDQGIYPHEFDLLSRGLDNWQPMCKLQEEQFFIPEASTRITLFQNHTGRPAAVISAQTPHWLFFGSYSFVRGICQGLNDKGAGGLFMDTGDGGINWITEEAFGRYLNDPDRAEDEEQSHWIARVRERYGGDVNAEGFLAAAEESSGIIPAIGCQLYYRNNNYKPQVGLPLISYLGMPSISSFRHTGIDRPELEQAFSWGIPRKKRWSRDWITVPEYVDDPHLADAATDVGPLETAEDVERRAQRTENLVRRLRAQQPERGADEFRRICDLMQLAAELGRHHGARLRAAVAYQEWLAGKRGAASATAAVMPLIIASLERYERAIEIMERVYGEGAPGGVIRIATVNMQPPWTRPGMQSFEGQIEGGMREMLRLLRVEQSLLADCLARDEKHVPQWDEIAAADAAE